MPKESNGNWLESIVGSNDRFRNDADLSSLPTARTPGRFGLITCMDPRINLAAMGIPPVDPEVQEHSDVRVIRTVGGMAEDRSLIVGIHLAGIREFAVVTHTDCGNHLAKQNIGKIINGLESTMEPDALQALREKSGMDWPAGLIDFLKAFDDPVAAARREVKAIKHKPFVPRDVIVHGLVYDLETAELKVVHNGYDTPK